MRHFNEWQDELRYRVMRVEPDEKYQNGVYDMAIDIAVAIEGRIGRQFDDKEIDEVIETIYNAIKYGDHIG